MRGIGGMDPLMVYTAFSIVLLLALHTVIPLLTTAAMARIHSMPLSPTTAFSMPKI